MSSSSQPDLTAGATVPAAAAVPRPMNVDWGFDLSAFPAHVSGGFAEQQPQQLAFDDAEAAQLAVPRSAAATLLPTGTPSTDFHAGNARSSGTLHAVGRAGDDDGSPAAFLVDSPDSMVSQGAAAVLAPADDAGTTGASGPTATRDQASTTAATKPPKSEQQVYEPGFAAVLTVPAERISHMPAASLNVTRLVMCSNFDPAVGEASCTMGARCKFVHADTRGVDTQRHTVHVNYAWRSLEEVTYARHEAGQEVRVAPPSSRAATDGLDTGRMLVTQALDAATRLGRPLRHCAHYYYNRACNLGDECTYVHSVHLDPSARQFQRAPMPRKEKARAAAAPRAQQPQQPQPHFAQQQQQPSLAGAVAPPTLMYAPQPPQPPQWMQAPPAGCDPSFMPTSGSYAHPSAGPPMIPYHHQPQQQQPSSVMFVPQPPQQQCAQPPPPMANSGGYPVVYGYFPPGPQGPPVQMQQQPPQLPQPQQQVFMMPGLAAGQQQW